MADQKLEAVPTFHPHAGFRDSPILVIAIIAKCPLRENRLPGQCMSSVRQQDRLLPARCALYLLRHGDSAQIVWTTLGASYPACHTARQPYVRRHNRFLFIPQDLRLLSPWRPFLSRVIDAGLLSLALMDKIFGETR
ncbi:hypothetical protein RRG08_011928 [Elysia crispata]|uniref:Uncharacterized protein n=1 Tax=Elysia crispata TaxID=231223 RepID=A0AAE0XUZ8_9GAST|nr:hypothetical protein RRG08_011928 [Elysia crispata]